MRTLRACVVIFVAACGGPSNTTVDGAADGAGSASNHVEGLVNGRAFGAKDAISASFSHTNGFNFNGSVEFVELADYAGACALAGQTMAPTDSRILDLAVAVNDATGKATVPTSPGTFTVYPSSLPASANVAQVYYGSGCGKDVAYTGTAGTITVTKVNANGSFEGTFDVTISCAGFSSCVGGDAHLTGGFASAACTALNVNVTQTCS